MVCLPTISVWIFHGTVPNWYNKWGSTASSTFFEVRFTDSGIHAFMDLAKEAKAIYRIRRIVLVNTEKLDEYIEMMYGDPESD